MDSEAIVISSSAEASQHVSSEASLSSAVGERPGHANRARDTAADTSASSTKTTDPKPRSRQLQLLSEPRDSHNAGQHPEGSKRGEQQQQQQQKQPQLPMPPPKQAQSSTARTRVKSAGGRSPPAKPSSTEEGRTRFRKTEIRERQHGQNRADVAEHPSPMELSMSSGASSSAANSASSSSVKHELDTRRPSAFHKSNPFHGEETGRDSSDQAYAAGTSPSPSSSSSSSAAAVAVRVDGVPTSASPSRPSSAIRARSPSREPLATVNTGKGRGRQPQHQQQRPRCRSRGSPEEGTHATHTHRPRRSAQGSENTDPELMELQRNVRSRHQGRADDGSGAGGGHDGGGNSAGDSEHGGLGDAFAGLVRGGATSSSERRTRSKNHGSRNHTSSTLIVISEEAPDEVPAASPAAANNHSNHNSHNNNNHNNSESSSWAHGGRSEAGKRVGGRKGTVVVVDDDDMDRTDDDDDDDEGDENRVGNVRTRATRNRAGRPGNDPKQHRRHQRKAQPLRLSLGSGSTSDDDNANNNDNDGGDLNNHDDDGEDGEEQEESIPEPLPLDEYRYQRRTQRHRPNKFAVPSPQRKVSANKKATNDGHDGRSGGFWGRGTGSSDGAKGGGGHTRSKRPRRRLDFDDDDDDDDDNGDDDGDESRDCAPLGDATVGDEDAENKAPVRPANQPLITKMLSARASSVSATRKPSPVKPRPSASGMSTASCSSKVPSSSPPVPSAPPSPSKRSAPASPAIRATTVPAPAAHDTLSKKKTSAQSDAAGASAGADMDAVTTATADGPTSSSSRPSMIVSSSKKQSSGPRTSGTAAVSSLPSSTSSSSSAPKHKKPKFSRILNRDKRASMTGSTSGTGFGAVTSASNAGSSSLPSTISTATTTTALSSSGSSSATAPASEFLLEPSKPPASFCGIRNLGNTCYLASVVQALRFVDHFRTCLRQCTLQKSRACGTAALCKESPFLQELIHLERQMEFLEDQEHRVSPITALEPLSVTPKDLKRQLGLVNPGFDNVYQHDAQEFLLFLLDEVERSQKKAIERAGLRASPCTEQLLNGVMLEATRCCACERIVRRETMSTALTLHFPDAATATSGSGSSTGGGEWRLHDNRIFSVVSLLDRHFGEEHLGGENKRECSECGCKQEATSQTRLARAPHVLMLHINRCTRPGHKIKAPVHAPAVLNLDDKWLDKAAFKNTAPPPTYRLKSVVFHTGASAASGHYFVVCRIPCVDPQAGRLPRPFSPPPYKHTGASSTTLSTTANTSATALKPTPNTFSSSSSAASSSAAAAKRATSPTDHGTPPRRPKTTTSSLSPQLSPLSAKPRAQLSSPTRAYPTNLKGSSSGSGGGGSTGSSGISSKKKRREHGYSPVVAGAKSGGQFLSNHSGAFEATSPMPATKSGSGELRTREASAAKKSRRAAVSGHASRARFSLPGPSFRPGSSKASSTSAAKSGSVDMEIALAAAPLGKPSSRGERMRTAAFKRTQLNNISSGSSSHRGGDKRKPKQFGLRGGSALDTTPSTIANRQGQSHTARPAPKMSSTGGSGGSGGSGNSSGGRRLGGGLASKLHGGETSSSKVTGEDERDWIKFNDSDVTYLSQSEFDAMMKAVNTRPDTYLFFYEAATATD